jgi:hypothetical protein
MTPSPPDEREAIVRWLRGLHDSIVRAKAATNNTIDIVGLTGSASAIRQSIDAISRGHHLSEQGEGYE